jgi:hypothetical protein
MRRRCPASTWRCSTRPRCARDAGRMVRDLVLLAAAAKHAPGARRRTPAAPVRQRPAVRGLRNPDGSVNRDMLAAQGMNSEMFAQQLRQELGMQQVLAGRRVRHRARRPPWPGRAGPAAAAPRGAGAALRPRRLPRQGQAHRRRPRGLLQGQRGAASGARAGRASSTWCSTSPPWQGRHRVRDELRKYYDRERQPLHRGRGAARQPHPDQGRQGRCRPPSAAKAKARAEACWPSAQGTRPALPSWRARTRRTPARPRRAATWTSSAAARWSSPSRMRSSR